MEGGEETHNVSGLEGGDMQGLQLDYKMEVGQALQVVRKVGSGKLSKHTCKGGGGYIKHTLLPPPLSFPAPTPLRNPFLY